jgi:hypothetical protein
VNVVIVPADDVVFIGVRLLSDAIIQDEHAIVLLTSPHVRFDNLPEIGRSSFGSSQKPLDAVVADLTIK